MGFKRLERFVSSGIFTGKSRVAVFGFLAFLLLCLYAFPAAAAISPAELQKAMQDFDTLKVDQHKGMWREPWEHLAKRFADMVAQGGALAPEALFYQARSMDELSARSKRRDDMQEAARLYNQLFDKFPDHALADNAGYNKALILAGRLGEPEAAADALEVVLSRHPGGDMHASAELLYSKLGRDPRLVKPKSSVAPPTPEPKKEDVPAAVAIESVNDTARQKALYQEASKHWRELIKGNSKESARRDVWETLEDDFKSARAIAPNGPLAASAAYQAARCRSELAARSFNADDWREAVALFHEVESGYPESTLADDALLHAATLRMEKLDDKAGALADVSLILQKYTRGDMRPEAAKLAKQLAHEVGAEMPAKAAGKTAERADVRQQPAPQQSVAEDTEAGISGPVSEDFEKASREEAARAAARTAESSGSGETGNGAVQSKTGSGILRRILWSGSESNATLTLELAGRSKYGRKTLAASGGKAATLRMTLFGAALDESVSKSLNLKGLPLGAVTSSVSGQNVQVDIAMPSAKSYRVTVLYNPYRLVIESSSQDMLPGGFTMKGQPIAGTAPPVAAATARVPVKKPSDDILDQLGLSINTVVVDAGHGGKDPGAIGNGIRESEYTLALAKALAQRLKQNGIDVLYTRKTDKYIALEDRTGFANDSRADVFVSIHVNASTNKKLSGIETYFLDVARSDAAAVVAARENAVKVNNTSDLQFILSDLTRNSKKAESEAIAGMVQSGMLHSLRKTGYSVYDNGVRSAPFYVLMGARMPAFLVEVGYLSNATDATRMKEDKYLNSLADGIASGILAYRDKLRASANGAGRRGK